jgi:hypothetical protein
MTALGPGCVKTKKWLPEIVFKLSTFSADSRSLIERSYRLHALLITYHAGFEVDLFPQSYEEFSHSLGREQTCLHGPIADGSSKALR